MPAVSSQHAWAASWKGGSTWRAQELVGTAKHDIQLSEMLAQQFKSIAYCPIIKTTTNTIRIKTENGVGVNALLSSQGITVIPRSCTRREYLCGLQGYLAKVSYSKRPGFHP